MRSSFTVPSVLGTLALLGLSAGCPSREVSEVKPNQVREEKKDIPVEVNRDVDILFVIDNSGSMGEEQISITNNFQRFINVLENIQGGLPNVHIGIVSSNTGVGGFTVQSCTGDGDNGRLQNAPRGACTPPSGYYISDVALPDGTRQKNYTGTLAETFTCIAKLGVTGCGLEQHFESMKRALDPQNPNSENAGFLRPNAFLAVIFLADEDDCSAKNPEVFNPAQTMVSDPLGPLSSFRCTEFGIQCGDPPEFLTREPAQYDPAGGDQECEPRGAMTDADQNEYMWHPQHYVDFLKSLKTDPNLLIVAGIVGNTDPVGVGRDMDMKPELLPSCETTAGKAAPGIRFKYFLDQFPNRNTFVSICNEDLSDALMQVAALLARVIGNPCLEGQIDATDIYPNEPGLQVACQVFDVRYPGMDNQTETVISRCVGDDPSGQPEYPCWRVYQDAENCSSFPTQLVLSVERNGVDPPTGTHVIASCETN